MKKGTGEAGDYRKQVQLPIVECGAKNAPFIGSEKIASDKTYYPQCNRFWSEKCPRKTGKKIKCRDCISQSWKKLGIAVLKRHLEGKAADASDVVGIHPLLPDDTCCFLVFDFDNHEKDTERECVSNANEKWKEEVEALREICRLNGIDALT